MINLLFRRGPFLTAALAGLVLSGATASARAGEGGTHAASSESYPFLCKCLQSPYSSGNCLYGYLDHVYGRGPVIDLGSASLSPGFRGYGPFGSPGYGLGTMPTSRIDRERPRIGIFGLIQRDRRRAGAYESRK